MLHPSTRGNGVAMLVCSLVAAVLLVVAAPRAATAMCCACTGCPDAGFCVDDVASALDCASLCSSLSCSGTVFDVDDTCDGGCDGAPDLPTATATVTPTGTATGTPTGTVSATATATPPTPALAGSIRYFTEDHPVADVEVILSGDAPAATSTDANGDYAFETVGTGDQTVLPSKDGDFNTAITAFDASTILRYVAGLEPLSSDQLLAADVTANGTVSALDATRILQFQAGLITEFVAQMACQSDWLFRPDPVVVPGQTLVQPMLLDETCTQGAIVYDETFTPPASGRDFVAILIGDVSGNWEPAPPPPEE